MNKEKVGNNFGELLIDLAKGGSGDGTNTPPKKEAPTIPPTPTQYEATTILPTPAEKAAGTISPTATEKETGTTAGSPIDRKQNSIHTPDRSATSHSESTSSNDNTEDE